MRNVKFLWTSEEVNKKPKEYWLRVLDIARKNPFERIKKCCTVMGREESDVMGAAQVLYPCMQCSDIFFLNADICQLGMDQRQVNLLAREYCDTMKADRKPVILSHSMVMGLFKDYEKQSMALPDITIFMQDSAECVNKKIRGAHCPPGVVRGNPVLNIMKLIVFQKYDKVLVSRTPENGGDVTYNSYVEMEEAYASQALHPADLKASAAKLINDMMQPVRDHFLTDPYARELYRKVRSYHITR